MQQWEYFMLAVSVNAWQKPVPVISVIDLGGQVIQHTFPTFHTYINDPGAHGWQLAHIEEHNWVFKRPRQELV
ncbi:MAG TPA: hypothetical protein VKY19_17310 [Ktedonosporobacter sp.]|jgi:hypothetical protein|nr:hypothetical protein [Ktedonosporobacter sp.]